MALISSGFVGRRCFIFWIFLAERRGSATLTNKAFRVRWVYLTFWIFKRSVRPMGPFGSPDTITIVLPFRASLSLLTVFSASAKIESVESISRLTVVTPHESSSCFSTSAWEVRATIGRGGLYFETRRAVLPVRVGVTMAAADIWSAVSHAANAIASSWLFSCHIRLCCVISLGR